MRRVLPHANVEVVPWHVPIAATPQVFAERAGIAFIGSYAHAPNLDGALRLPEPMMMAALSCSIWLVPVWVGALVWLWHATRPPRPSAILTAITAIGFVALPPLMAFGLYFGMVHSPRHLLRLAAWFDPDDPRRAARWAAGVVVPAGLVCALGIAALALTAPDASIGILVPMFRLIAALTLPHMIVTTWLAHDGPHGPDGSMHPTDIDPLAWHALP